MRHLSVVAGFALLLGGCGETARGPVVPVELNEESVCALDGMLLTDYPGPRAQIHYAQGAPELYCDTMEMFAIQFSTGQARKIVALYVQDMGSTPWENPQGHWIDARAAYYVHGSSRHGAMGPTLASFAGEEAAARFAREYGGKLLRFDEVTPDLVALDGGALHDQAM